MTAISVRMRTKFACNVSYVRNHICLQCLKILKHLQSDRVGLKSHLKKLVVASLFGPNRILIRPGPNRVHIRYIWTPFGTVGIIIFESKRELRERTVTGGIGPVDLWLRELLFSINWRDLIQKQLSNSELSQPDKPDNNWEDYCR